MAKASKMHVRKNDQVVVVSGKDRGKRGRVLEVYPAQGRVLVEGVNIVKRHTKPNPQRNVKGGIASKEAAVHASNVMLIDPDSGSPTRVGYRLEQDGTKTRIARRSGAALGTLSREQDRRGRGPAPSPEAAPKSRKAAPKKAVKAAPKKAAKAAAPKAKKAAPKKTGRSA
jgi:large subunit ribosomal protein L24